MLFLKTHKTGSSTVSNIIFRYGESRGLSFILGRDTTIGWPKRFRLRHSLPRNGSRPNILCSHTRYSKTTMNHLFPKPSSVYITILRNPVDQFESTFNFVGFGQIYGLGKDPTESLKRFLRTGITFEGITKSHLTVLARNPMAFDLGLDFQFHQNATAIKEYIAFLEKEFDLVMIMDYFEESVVLLKRLLCWEFDDILHIKTMERQDKEKAELSSQLKENIRRWNKADVLLYDHFHRIFWQKIKMQGKGFYEDLATFRRMKEEMMRTCYNGTTLQRAYSNKYVKTRSLNPNLPPETKQKCEKLTRRENSYVEYLRKKQSFKSPGDLQPLSNEQDEPNYISWEVAQDLIYDPVPV